MLTRERLKELLIYYPNTGNFYWNIPRGSKKKYSKAGTENRGYKYVKIDGKKYSCHRLAFVFMTGYFPEEIYDIDHIDGNKGNNVWSNLRIAKRFQNSANAKLNKNNQLGVKNVRKLPDTGKYQVIIGGKSYGCYDDIELAELVATEVRVKQYGSFARHA